MDNLRQTIELSRAKLKNAIRAAGFKGYDPLDALNSPVLSRLTFGSKTIALFYTQALKRAPWNIRPLLGINPIEDPKGYALFYFGCKIRDELADASAAAQKILNLQFKRDKTRTAWGYLYPWVGFAHGFWPLGTAEAVPTVFAAEALLDAAKTFKEPLYAQSANQAVEYLLAEHLIKNNDIYISYFPGYKNIVHNVTALGALLLARAGKNLDNRGYLEIASKLIETTLKYQRSDGAWDYGTSSRQKWVDSYHQGYILHSLSEASRLLETRQWEKPLASGLDFWQKNFFGPDNEVYCYPNKYYPVDPHVYACAAIELLYFKDRLPDAKKKAGDIALRIIAAMQKDNGLFYYLKTRFFTYDILYMRWTQMWMFYALSRLRAEL